MLFRKDINTFVYKETLNSSLCRFEFFPIAPYEQFSIILVYPRLIKSGPTYRITTIEITRHSLIPKCLTFFFLAFPVLLILACGHGYFATSVCLLIWFYFCGLTMYLCYRFKVCGNSKIKTWQTCARWPRSSRIGSCLSRSVMLKG